MMLLGTELCFDDPIATDAARRIQKGWVYFWCHYIFSAAKLQESRAGCTYGVSLVKNVFCGAWKRLPCPTTI